MDEPQGLPETGGYATAAYNSGSVAGKIIERVGPLLGLAPRFETPEEPFPLLARMGYGFVNVPAMAAEDIDAARRNAAAAPGWTPSLGRSRDRRAQRGQPHGGARFRIFRRFPVSAATA